MSNPFEYGAYIPKSEEELDFLKSYNPDKWKKASNTTDMAIFAVSEKGLELLLVRRGGFPYRDMYCLPGGFINMDESLDETAARELSEETGLSGLPLYQVYTYGQPGREPRDRCVTTLYTTLLNKNTLNAKAGDDAAAADWFLLSDYEKETSSAGDAKEEYVSLRLTGKKTFTPQIKRSVTFNIYKKTEVTVPDNGGLGFDHARLIIDAYEYLRREFTRTDMARDILGYSFDIADLKMLYKYVFSEEMTDADVASMPVEQDSGSIYRFV